MVILKKRVTAIQHEDGLGHGAHQTWWFSCCPSCHHFSCGMTVWIDYNYAYRPLRVWFSYFLFWSSHQMMSETSIQAFNTSERIIGKYLLDEDRVKCRKGWWSPASWFLKRMIMMIQTTDDHPHLNDFKNWLIIYIISFSCFEKWRSDHHFWSLDSLRGSIDSPLSPHVSSFHLPIVMSRMEERKR